RTGAAKSTALNVQLGLRGSVFELGSGRSHALRRTNRLRLDWTGTAASWLGVVFQAFHASLELGHGLAQRTAELRQVAAEEQHTQHKEKHDLLCAEAQKAKQWGNSRGHNGLSSSEQH